MRPLITTITTLHQLVGDPYTLMQQGVVLVLLSVAIISGLVLNQYIDIRRQVEAHQTGVIILGTVVLFAFSIASSTPMAILLGGSIAFAVFFGLALSLTVLILYYLRRIPIGGRA